MRTSGTVETVLQGAFKTHKGRTIQSKKRSIESNDVQVRVGSDHNLVHIVLWSHKG